MNENALELVCIGWLKELGYECLEEVKVNPEENIKIRKSNVVPLIRPLNSVL